MGPPDILYQGTKLYGVGQLAYLAFFSEIGSMSLTNQSTRNKPTNCLVIFHCCEMVVAVFSRVHTAHNLLPDFLSVGPSHFITEIFQPCFFTALEGVLLVTTTNAIVHVKRVYNTYMRE